MTDTVTDLVALRGILAALAEDIDDTLAWAALADWGEESGQNWWSAAEAAEAASRRVHNLVEAYTLVAPTREGRQRCSHVELHGHYREPGYSDPVSGVIATGNWNVITRTVMTDGRWDGREALDASPGALSKALEALGVTLEWSDEWTACHQCAGLVRTQPDGHHWTPSYELSEEHGLLCLACHGERQGSQEDGLYGLSQAPGSAEDEDDANPE